MDGGCVEGFQKALLFCINKMMIIQSIKTRILNPPKDDLLNVIAASLNSLPENSVLVITSKVLSIWQERCVSMPPQPTKDDKDMLVRREADFYLPRDLVPSAWVMHTLKNNVFIPSAGIDESNAAGHYILW